MNGYILTHPFCQAQLRFHLFSWSKNNNFYVQMCILYHVGKVQFFPKGQKVEHYYEMKLMNGGVHWLFYGSISCFLHNCELVWFASKYNEQQLTLLMEYHITLNILFDTVTVCIHFFALIRPFTIMRNIIYSYTMKSVFCQRERAKLD